MNNRTRSLALFLLFVLAALLAACVGPAAPQSGKLRVLATTNILGDVVAAVGGDLIDLTVLLPLGSDPHSFEPSPADVAAVNDADVVFINGLGLEAFLDDLLQTAGGNAQVITVSAGITTLALEGEHGDVDPHVWMDPANVLIWVDNIAAALIAHDPKNAEAFQANAGAYKAKLQELDAWITGQLASLEPSQRKLVTDHDALGYFANKYDFELVGAIVPGYSTLAQPSAQELAALEDTIASYDVPAIFVGSTVNPVLARQVAEDMGTRLTVLYVGSLSDSAGPAPTYLEMMRYDVAVIVEALG